MTHLRQHYELYLSLLLQRLMKRSWNSRELEQRIEAQHRTLLAQERGYPGRPEQLREDMHAYLAMIEGQLDLSFAAVERMTILRSPTKRAERDRYVAYREALLSEQDRVLAALEAQPLDRSCGTERQEA